MLLGQLFETGHLTPSFQLKMKHLFNDHKISGMSCAQKSPAFYSRFSGCLWSCLGSLGHFEFRVHFVADHSLLSLGGRTDIR